MGDRTRCRGAGGGRWVVIEKGDSRQPKKIGDYLSLSVAVALTGRGSCSGSNRLVYMSTDCVNAGVRSVSFPAGDCARAPDGSR